MSEIVDLSDRRPPVTYELFIEHSWKGEIRVWANGVSDTPQTNAAIADALRAFADSIDPALS